MNATASCTNITTQAESDLMFAYSRPFIAIFAVAGILSNFALILTILLDPLKCLRTTTGFLTVNLILNDLLCALLVFVSCVGNWTEDDAVVLVTIALFFVTGSCVFAVVLSIDRFLLVAYPVKYHRCECKTKIVVINALAWLVILCLTLSTCYMYMNFHNDWKYHLTLPVEGLKIFLYLYINRETLKKLRKLQENFKDQTKNSGVIQTTAERKRLAVEKRFCNVLLIMLLNYILFTLPLTIFNHVGVFIGQSSGTLKVLKIWCISIVFWFVSLHCLVDPISHFAGIRKYWKSLLAIRLR